MKRILGSITTKSRRLIGVLTLGLGFVVLGTLAWQTRAQIAELFNEDPDLGRFSMKTLKDSFSKEEFKLRRAEGVGLKRGVKEDELPDPKLRSEAIKEMERQERALERSSSPDAPDAQLAAWTEIGPNPIPNGQVGNGPSTPVSGRTIAIAVHPTNPAIVYVGTANGGLYRSTNSGATWTALMDNAESLAIGAIAISPSQPETVYVGTGEGNFSLDSFFGVGVYRIDNASTSATITGPLNDDALNNDVFTGLAVSEIRVHPTLPGTIFVSTTRGLGGIGGVASNVVPASGIFRSTDATSADPTFTKLTGLDGNNSVSVRDIVIDPLNPNLLVANVTRQNGGIYVSTDALAAAPTFVNRLTFPDAGTSNQTAEFALQHTAGPNPTIYAATGFGGGRVYINTDGGTTWTQQIDNNFCTPQCFYDIAIDVDPTNAANVFLGGAPFNPAPNPDTGLVFGRSSDSGATFSADGANTTLSLHVDTQAIAVAPSNPAIVYFGSDGGIYRTDNVAATPIVWNNLNNGTFKATQFMGLAIHPTDPNFTIGGTQDNGTNYYTPAGTWTRVDGGDGGYAVIDTNAANTTNVRQYHTYFNTTQGTGLVGYATESTAGGGFATFRGCNGGAGNGIPCGGSVLFYAPLEQGPGNPNSIYLGADILYRSGDLGANHTAVSQSFGNPISAIGISPQNDNVRIVGVSDGQLFGTTTGATTLTNLDSGGTIPNGFVARAVIDPNNANIAYVTLSNFGVVNVWRTVNLNAANPTWTAASTGLPQVPVSGFIVDPAASNVLYAGTDIGVFSSVDSGASWLPFGTGLPRVPVFDLAKTSGNLIRIATHGRGMWETAALAAQPTATTVTGAPNPIVQGQTLTMTATVTSGGGAVTVGTVTFRDGGADCTTGTVIGGPTAVNGMGVASATTNALSIGTHTIRACYSGSAGFLASNGTYVQVVLDPIFTYNASANPGSPRYTLRVNGTNYEIRDSQTNALLASQPIAGTTEIRVNGINAALDILTVDFSGGNITIPVRFDGGTGGPDSMNTLGGTFGDCTSTPSSANNGTLVCTGGSSAGSNLTYIGLEPINDANVVANYTINGTAGINNIAVINGPGGTVQVNSGVTPTFELINFTNKTNVIINARASADVTTVNFSVVPNALQSITLNTGLGGDQTNVISVPTTVTLNIDGGIDGDLTVIGNSLALVNQEDGSLLNINGTINLTGIMTLGIDDSGNLQNQTYTATAIPAVPVFGGNGQKIDRPAAPGDINSTTNVAVVFFFGGKGSDTFNLTSTGFFLVGAVAGNAGDDVFNVNGSGLSGLGASLVGGPGRDTFNVSPAPNSGIATMVIDGGDPTTFPGDVLNINTTGVSNPVLAIGANGNGSFTSTSHQTINIQGIEVQAPTTTTIAATAATTYGANVTFTATVATQMPGTGSPTGTVSFLADGSPIAGCTTVAVTAVPTTTATASCTTNTLAAGVRAISAVFTPTGTYYQTSTGTSNHTVNKAVLTVTADNQARAYGAANPTLTATITGFVLSQNLGTSGVTGTPTLATTATPTSPVGAYPITATVGTLAAANYSFTFVNGTLTVNKAVITVTGDNKSRVFGAPNPALTVTYTGFVNGEVFANSGITGAPGISTTATQSSPVVVGGYPITVTTNTLAAANYSFTLVNGTLTITQAATTTTITNAGSLGNPTVGVPYAVNFTVGPVAPSTGTPTGTVTVSDGTGATCTASVAAGTCNLTSTTPGPKTITATYPGDTNFTGSSSLTIPVNVFIAMTGNVKQHVAFGTNTNLAGVTLTLTNTTTNSVVSQATSDASGNYSFGVLSAGGNYRIIPSGLGKTYEAENRSYTNVVGNIAGADFVAYDVPGPNANPRGARVTNQTTTPGQSVTVPIVMAKVGNEARIAFSIDYAAGVLGVPTITCGTGEPGCTVVVNNSLAGRAGVTITPAGGTFNAGVTEIARVTFPTFATTLTNTPIRFGDFPTARDVRNADNNPLPTLYWTDGTVSFTSSTVLDGATVSGRVLTSNGQGVRNATVTITDSTGSRRTATTSSFGTYTFEGLQVGTTYAIAVSSKRYRFQTRVVNVTENLTDINFTGQE